MAAYLHSANRALVIELLLAADAIRALSVVLARKTRQSTSVEERNDSDQHVAPSGAYGHRSDSRSNDIRSAQTDRTRKGPYRDGSGSIFLSFQSRQDAGNRRLRRHPAARRPLGKFSRLLQGRDRQD